MSIRKSGEEKKKRVSINGDRHHFEAGGLDTENFHYCWVNDLINHDADNIQKYIDAGYDFVLKDESGKYVTEPDRGSTMTGLKVSKPVGVGRTAFLMRVPNEYYNQDLEEYNSKVDAAEQAWKEQKRDNGLYGNVEVSTGYTRKS